MAQLDDYCMHSSLVRPISPHTLCTPHWKQSIELQAAWEAHHSLLCLGESGSNDGADAEALQRFGRHADASNDIFHVAARAVAGACLRAQQLLGQDWWVHTTSCVSSSPQGTRGVPTADIRCTPHTVPCSTLKMGCH